MVWGSFLIVAAALKKPMRNGYNAQGVNHTFQASLSTLEARTSLNDLGRSAGSRPPSVSPQLCRVPSEVHPRGWSVDGGMLTPKGYPPLQHSSRHGPQRTQHTASTATIPRYPQGRIQASLSTLDPSTSFNTLGRSTAHPLRIPTPLERGKTTR